MSSSIVNEPKSKVKTWGEMNNRKKKFLETNLDKVNTTTTSSVTGSESSTISSSTTATANAVSTPKSLAISIETSEFSELKILRTRTRSARGPGSIAALNNSSSTTKTSTTACTTQGSNGNNSYSVSSSNVSTPERDRSISYKSFSNHSEAITPPTPPPSFSSLTSKYTPSKSSIHPPPPPVSPSVLITNVDPSATLPVKTTIVPIMTSPLMTSESKSPVMTKEPSMTGKERLKLKEAFQLETIPDVKDGHKEKYRVNEDHSGRGGDFCYDVIVFVGDCFLCHGERKY